MTTLRQDCINAYLETEEAFKDFFKYYKKECNGLLDKEQNKALIELYKLWKEISSNIGTKRYYYIFTEEGYSVLYDIKSFHSTIGSYILFKPEGNPWVLYVQASARARFILQIYVSSLPPIFRDEKLSWSHIKNLLELLDASDSPVSRKTTDVVLMYLDDNNRFSCENDPKNETLVGAAFVSSMKYDIEKIYKNPYMLEHICIIENMRGKGLGSQLLERVSEQYELVCIVNNPELVPFYNKNGYVFFSTTVFPTYYKL